MKAEELVKAGEKLYGKTGWQHQLAADLDVDGSTIRRWVSGAIAVPGPVAAALRCFLKNRKA